jgi:hypothetical protein
VLGGLMGGAEDQNVLEQESQAETYNRKDLQVPVTWVDQG